MQRGKQAGKFTCCAAGKAISMIPLSTQQIKSGTFLSKHFGYQR